MWVIFLIFVAALAIPSVHDKISDYVTARNLQSQLQLQQLALDCVSDDGGNRTIQIFLASYFPTAVAINISQQCIDDSKIYFRGFLQFENWALQSEYRYIFML